MKLKKEREAKQAEIQKMALVQKEKAISDAAQKKKEKE